MLRFAVLPLFLGACGPTSLELTFATSGEEIDPDGYLLVFEGLDEPVRAAANGTTTIDGVSRGVQQVLLEGVAINCDPLQGRLNRTIDVGGNTALLIEMVCTRKELVFQSDRDGDWQLYRMNVDGTGQRALTSTPAVATGGGSLHPVWSPDGERIAFVSDRDAADCTHPDGCTDVYMMDADGSNVVRITDRDAPTLHPSWSPDSQQLAFLSPVDGVHQVFVAGYDGLFEEALTSLTIQCAEGPDSMRPSWGPTGRIAYVGCGGNEAPRIFTMNGDGTNSVQLTFEGGEGDGNPSWSDDGEQIVFQRRFETEGVGLHSVPSAGGGVVRRTPPYTNEVEGRFAIGEQALTFTTLFNQSEVCIGPTDRPGAQLLTENPAEDRYPDWRP